MPLADCVVAADASGSCFEHPTAAARTAINRNARRMPYSIRPTAARARSCNAFSACGRSSFAMSCEHRERPRSPSLAKRHPKSLRMPRASSRRSTTARASSADTADRLVAKRLPGLGFKADRPCRSSGRESRRRRNQDPSHRCTMSAATAGSGSPGAGEDAVLVDAPISFGLLHLRQRLPDFGKLQQAARPVAGRNVRRHSLGRRTAAAGRNGRGTAVMAKAARMPVESKVLRPCASPFRSLYKR